MKKGSLLTALLFLGISLFWQARSRFVEATIQEGYRPPLNEAARQILEATVHLLMLAPDAPAGPNHVFRMVDGIGTLQVIQGQAWLLTHNHWKEDLGWAELVEIRDSEHHLLTVMSLSQFRRAIHYQDEGSLLLKLPPLFQEKLLPAESNIGVLPTPITDGEKLVQPGDIVQVTHQPIGGPENISVRPAQVESLSTFRGIPVIWLVTLDGLPIVKGDSGGGVWFEGRLVANLWASPYVVETGARTSRGFAALIPAEGFSGSSHNPVDTDVDNQQISP